METSQDWLEKFGLASPTRDGPAPRVPEAQLRLEPLRNPSPADTRSKAKREHDRRIMLREARIRQRDRDYQLALQYRGEQHKDDDEHWDQRPIVEVELTKLPLSRPPEKLSAISENLGLIRKRKRKIIIGHSIKHRLVTARKLSLSVPKSLAKARIRAIQKELESADC